MGRDIAWIAVDWGTTNLRAYAIGDSGKIIDRRLSTQGMSKLDASEFEPALHKLIECWHLRTKSNRIIACGMVGAAQGWVDAGYSEVPCAPVIGQTTVTAPTISRKWRVQVIPGLCQRSPDDVMRGEETQIAGFLTSEPEFSGVICLPGTHSKWVQIAAGQVQSFSTYMTGEMFEILSRQSVLRFSVEDRGWDDVAFLGAVEQVLGGDHNFGAALFGLRASSILSHVPNAASKSTLSGLLIGHELAATRALWENEPVVIIGDSALSDLYQDVLAYLGTEARAVGAEAAIVRGMSRMVRHVSDEMTHG